MNRFSVKILCAVAGVAVVAISQVALAQQDEGRRGRGGPGGRGFGGGFPVTAVRLAAESDEVQAALKLTDEQKKKAEEINDQLRDDVGAVLQGGQGRGEIQKLYKEASAKLDEVLDDDQQKRLAGIAVQVNGPNSVMEPAVAKELNITDEQNGELAEVRESNMRAMGDLFSEMRDQNLSREEMRDKFGELRTEANKKLLAVLTPEQQDKLESLKGEAVDIDMSQFRGFGGRRGGEGRDRDRDRDRDGERGERNRDADEREPAASTN